MKGPTCAFWIPIMIVAVLGLGSCKKSGQPDGATQLDRATLKANSYIGSGRCRKCHEHFYQLWSTSNHGLAMQPYTPELAKSKLTPQEKEITIGKRSYQAEISEDQGWVRERGPEGERRYPMVHVMGGKNVYYFLTPMQRGRLQVLPVAYDLKTRKWYDTAGSGVRHFPDRRDEALDWTDRLFTFNTACFSCHVSQLATNYNLEKDTYETTWLEPGINCESCHGPSGEHARAAEALSPGQSMQDLRLIRTKVFPPDKMNDLCASCHAKAVPLSTSFHPGDEFFDHYDLLTLEHPDFCPDGRDLGENYTFTSWLMSPCLKSERIDCNDCHTPSGRLRFQGEKSNEVCLPCHAVKVKNPTAHTHHRAESAGNHCVACHMPKTEFAAMSRSDHSMLPPTPAATLAFQSPNACNLCHADRDARWADRLVRKWAKRDYQKPVLDRAGLIDAARKGDWRRLPEMLALVTRPETNQVIKASMVRLLSGCQDDRKWPTLIKALRDPWPLVRASAAAGLYGHYTPEALTALLEATVDPSRLVRIRAASSLGRLPRETLGEKALKDLEAADAEFLAAMKARPDDWASYANLGNYYFGRQQPDQAIGYFETAIRIESRMVGTWVNLALAYNAVGRNGKAESSLRRALTLDAGNTAANFNLGLLLAETGKTEEAEQALRAALKADPTMAQAAYNLAVIVSKKNLQEAIDLCRKAVEISPRELKYVRSLSFYLGQKGDLNAAAEVWRELIRRDLDHEEAYLALGKILEAQGKTAEADAIYRRGAAPRTKAQPTNSPSPP